MTLHKLSAGDGYTYLTRQVASADERRAPGQALADYYAATGNPPGRWMGRGAADLGVAGQVTEAQMKALFGRGEHPDADAIASEVGASGAPPEVVRQAVRLGRRYPEYEAPGRQAVAGYDLAFTPVKSASVLWALGPPDIRVAVEAAHHEAVADAIAFLEANAAFTRVGDRGQAQIETRGLICAAFDHRETRVGDPDLHTHVAVSNKVGTREDGPDGRPRWRALDGRALYAVGVAASERYNTRFEDALARRLGVRFTARADTVAAGKRPVREIVGVPEVLVRHFSSRRAAIEERYAELARKYRTEHGHEPSRSAQLKLAERATLETREGKPPPKAFGAQLGEWRAEAERVAGQGVGARIVDAATGRALGTVNVDDVDVAALACSVTAVMEGERSTWSRWNLVAEVERQTRALRCATPGDRDRLIHAVVAEASDARNAVRITPPVLVPEPEQLRRSNGTSVFTPHAVERYTTERILAAEERLVAAARESTGVVVRPRGVDAVLERVERDEGLPLDAGQKALVRAFLENDRRVVVGIGPAGSGKTTAMRAACLAWEAAGQRVVALATSAKAAEVLAADLTRRAENLPKFLHELDLLAKGEAPRHGPDGAFFTLRRGDVVLVDEAGMAGTLRLDRLVGYARTAGAQVRLLGDPAQLAAVEAGGALRLLVTEAGAAHLTHLHRFADPEHAAATVRLRAGDPRGLDYYFSHGRVRGGTRDAMLDRVYQAWRADVASGRNSVMVAATTVDVAALNTRARLDRIAEGLSEASGVVLHDGTRAGTGDLVVTRENQRLLLTHGGRDFIKNGDTWAVRGRQADGSLLVEHTGHHGRVLLPAAYIAAHVELAYAATAHRMQGATVDTAHAFVPPGTTREALYVAASRARAATTLYVATEDLLNLDAEPLDHRTRTARQVLEAVLATEAGERSATETIRRTLAEAEALPALLARYEHGLAAANRERYAHIAERVFAGSVAARLTADPAWPALCHTLGTAEQNGYPADRIMSAVAGRHELVAAEFPAQLLGSWMNEHRAFRQPSPQRCGGPLPTWIATPPTDHLASEWRDYLDQMHRTITGRVRHLAERAVADRAPWLPPGGPSPGDPRRERWLELVGVVAAYREQYGIIGHHPLGQWQTESSPRHHAWLEAAGALRALNTMRGLERSPIAPGMLHPEISRGLSIDGP